MYVHQELVFNVLTFWVSHSPILIYVFALLSIIDGLSCNTRIIPPNVLQQPDLPRYL
jgi:hypothetical protein